MRHTPIDAAFDILSLNVELLEFLPTSRGVTPPGRRPVEGSYDAQGRKLYHAMLHFVGRQIPEMCSEYLVSDPCRTAFETDLLYRMERNVSWKERNACQKRTILNCEHPDFTT